MLSSTYPSIRKEEVQFFEIPGHEDKKVIRKSLAAIAKELPCLSFGEIIGMGRPWKRTVRIIRGEGGPRVLCVDKDYGNLTDHYNEVQIKSVHE
jgi:hypothetical protein